VSYLASHRPSASLPAEALVHGFTRGLAVGGVIAVAAAVIVAVLMNTPRPARRAAEAEPIFSG
jgi:hypothetical protein